MALRRERRGSERRRRRQQPSHGKPLFPPRRPDRPPTSESPPLLLSGEGEGANEPFLLDREAGKPTNGGSHGGEGRPRPRGRGRSRRPRGPFPRGSEAQPGTRLRTLNQTKRGSTEPSRSRRGRTAARGGGEAPAPGAGVGRHQGRVGACARGAAAGAKRTPRPRRAGSGGRLPPLRWNLRGAAMRGTTSEARSPPLDEGGERARAASS